MKPLLLLLLLVLILPGCASLFSSDEQSVSVNTLDGKNVKAVITQGDATQKVTLPAVIPVKRNGKKVHIAIREQDNPCYKSSEHEIPQSFNTVVLANILGLWVSELSTVTDFVTGKIWSYDSTTLIIEPSDKADCR